MPGRVVIFGWAESIHIQRWVQGLTERGWQIRLVSQGGGPVPGVETINLGRYGKLSYFRHASEAVRLARAFEPDLVHVHYAAGFGLWAFRCDFAPLLVSVWGFDVVDLPKFSLQKHMIRRVLRRADQVSATSDFLRGVCVKLAPEAEDRTTVIPFGVIIPQSFAPLPELPVRLCYIKMHRPKYGPDVLLRALARVRQVVPDIRLTMAGDGEMTPVLKELTVTLGLQANVEFVGFVPNERIYSLLQEHHIMVMPSLSESFGVAVLEAAACGRPSIASRVGGVPEVIRDRDTGLMVPPGDETALADAIVRLSGDLANIEKLGAAARHMVETCFSWNRSLDLMSDLYRRLIASE